jgi:hypothetical protein
MSRGQTTDQRRLDKERNKEKRESLLSVQDMAEVMALPAGRRFLYRLIYGRCELQSVYLAQDSGIYKHEGKRGVGADLAQELQTNHTEAFILMITERMRDLKYDSQIREEPTPTGDDQ